MPKNIYKTILPKFILINFFHIVVNTGHDYEAHFSIQWIFLDISTIFDTG